MPPALIAAVPADRTNALVELVRRRGGGEVRIRATSPHLVLLIEHDLSDAALEALGAAAARLLGLGPVHVETLAGTPAWRQAATWANAHRIAPPAADDEAGG